MVKSFTLTNMILEDKDDNHHNDKETGQEMPGIALYLGGKVTLPDSVLLEFCTYADSSSSFKVTIQHVREYTAYARVDVRAPITFIKI